MKLKLLIILTIASFSAFGQTRKETIDWLNSKFESSPIIRNSIEQSTRFLKIEDTGNFSIQEFSYATNVALPTSRN